MGLWHLQLSAKLFVKVIIYFVAPNIAHQKRGQLTLSPAPPPLHFISAGMTDSISALKRGSERVDGQNENKAVPFRQLDPEEQNENDLVSPGERAVIWQ